MRKDRFNYFNLKVNEALTSVYVKNFSYLTKFIKSCKKFI